VKKAKKRFCLSQYSTIKGANNVFIDGKQVLAIEYLGGGGGH
jgi:hypothetical protein